MTKSNKFIYRTAGIVINDQKVLLHRLENDNFWALPGGKVEFGETSYEALKREIQEEIKGEILIDRLTFTVESFFEDESHNIHEIGLYYLFNFAVVSNNFYSQKEFQGVEGEDDSSKRLLFQWFHLDRLSSIDLRPQFLKEDLQHIPQTLRHIIQPRII